MLNTCKILRVIAIRTYWLSNSFFGQKWEFQPNTYESYVLGIRTYWALTYVQDWKHLCCIHIMILNLLQFVSS